jgi:hypothetical protein
MIKKCTKMPRVFAVLSCLTATYTHCFHKQKQTCNAIALEQRFAHNVLIEWKKSIDQAFKKHMPYEIFIYKIVPFVARRKYALCREIPLVSSAEIFKIDFLPTGQIKTVDSEKVTRHNLLEHEIPMLDSIEQQPFLLADIKNKRIDIFESFSSNLPRLQRICTKCKLYDSATRNSLYVALGSLIAVALQDSIALFCLIPKVKPILNVLWNDIEQKQPAIETSRK